MNSTLNPSGEEDAPSGLLEHDRPVPLEHSAHQGEPARREIPAHTAPSNHTLTDHSRAARKGGSSAGRWLIISILFALVIVGAVLWQRARAGDQLAVATHELAVPSVLTTTPKAGPAETEVVLPGNLMAYSEAPIYARTSGYVKAWYTDIGTKVTAGQVMAELDAPDVDAEVRQATANLSQTRANLELDKLNFERSKSLLASNAVSKQQFDQNRTALDAQEAAVQAGEANLQNLKVMQDFQKIVAPFPGVVTRRNTDVGSLINAGTGGANNAQELFHLARTDILRVFINVPQVYSSLVQIDTPAYLVLAENPAKKFAGKVAHTAGAIDPASRTLLVEVQVPNPDGNLFPGAYADVHLVLKIKSATSVIPVNALLFRAEGTQVGVVDDSGVVHLKNVTLGHDFGTTLEVADGVDSRDRIILNPSDSLADGAKVRVESASAEKAAK